MNAVQAVKEWKLISQSSGKKSVVDKRASCQKDSLLQK